MNRNLLIVMGGGLAVALLVLLLLTMGGKKDNNQTEILIATKNLTVGSELKETHLKWQSWPKDGVVPGAIVRQNNQKTVEAAKGRLRRDLAAGEPVLQNMLVAEGQGNMLATMLEPGKRAIAIKVSAESMVGGFISPGDRVDVVLTHQVRVNGEARDASRELIDRHATETVLENVRVLAVDQRARKENDEAKVARTVTLEVDGKGAERMALAGAMGELSLSLRSLSDAANKNTTPIEATTDVQVSTVLQQVAEAERSSGGSSNMVRVYSQTGIVNVPVRQ